MKNPKVPTSKDYTDKCNGCGLCCIFREKDGDVFNFGDVTPEHTDCEHLQRLSNGLTLCRIHGKHTGTIIQNTTKTATGICTDIMQIKALFEDCPYNEDKILLRLQGESNGT